MNSIVEEIKARLDIVDLIGEHVDLKRAGQNFKGLCPFHAEKTPSFLVSPSKQMFHCFGCHKGGDILAFVIDYENMNFQEAVSYLSGKAGIKVEEFHGGSKANKGIKENMLAMYKEASAFFSNNLKTSKQTSSYISERGLNNETINKFSLGYSRNEKDALLNHLKSLSFQEPQIKASGLVYYGENGAHDFFRDRLMFPIFDLQGKIIAFGGRTLSTSKNMPKYINSPDSAIFKKGENIYGLNLAKNAITKKGYSIIVEGYIDVIVCHQYGFENTVAPLGTALTPGHLKKLRRFGNKVLLIFDGDQAGISATKRSLELVYAEGLIAKVLLMPEGEDPDTYLRRNGSENFGKYMSRVITPVEFALKIFGKNMLDAVRYLLNILSSCPDPLLRAETLRELADKSRISELELRGELKNLGRKTLKDNSRQTAHTGTAGKKIPSGDTRINREEEILFNIALSIPEKRRQILSILDPESIDNRTIRAMFIKIKETSARDRDNSFLDELMDNCDPEERSLISRLLINQQIDPEHIDQNIGDCIKTLSLRRIEKQIEIAGQAGDEKLLYSLLSEKNRLTSQKAS